MDGILITNATLFVGPELTPVHGSVLMEQGKITQIYENEAPVFPAERIQTIDGTGKYVIPGLIDCHNHLALDTTLPNYLERMNSDKDTLLNTGYDTLRRDLYSGVTTARCAGDRFYMDVYCKEEIRAGRLTGPALLVSGVGMRSPKGHGYVGMPFEGEEALRGIIMENTRQGVDWIKYYATGTAPKDGVIQSFYSRQEVKCIIDTAHSQGLPVTSHCIGGQGLVDGVEAGIDCLEHLYCASQADIDLVVKHNVKVCLTPSEYFVDIENAPMASRMLFRSLHPLATESMKAVVASGIKFGLGTDGLHQGLWKEAELMVSFGASNHDVLCAVTINGARLLDIHDRVGMLAAGMEADAVILRDDPLLNVQALKSVETVIKNGKIAAYCPEKMA